MTRRRWLTVICRRAQRDRARDGEAPGRVASETTAMELDDYQLKAIRTDQRPGDDEGAVMFPIIGLASEVGTLVKHFKKRIRDGDAHELFADEVAEELGDVLWYVANLASKLDLSLESIAARNLSKVSARWPVEEDPLPLPLADESFPADEQAATPR